MLEIDAVDENDTLDDKDEKGLSNSLHKSLLQDRRILVVDEAGTRREETVAIVKKILPNAKVETANGPEEAEIKMYKKSYDTFVVNLLMPGYSASSFVKAIHNHDEHPLMVGFAADKMSDAYDPKKGIKIKPLRKLFEVDSFRELGDEPVDDY